MLLDGAEKSDCGAGFLGLNDKTDAICQSQIDRVNIRLRNTEGLHGGLRPIEECAFARSDKDVAGIQIQVIDGVGDFRCFQLQKGLDNPLLCGLDLFAG